MPAAPYPSQSYAPGPPPPYQENGKKHNHDLKTKRSKLFQIMALNLRQTGSEGFRFGDVISFQDVG